MTIYFQTKPYVIPVNCTFSVTAQASARMATQERFKADPSWGERCDVKRFTGRLGELLVINYIILYNYYIIIYIHMYISMYTCIYIYIICIIVITVMNHSYYFVSMWCYDHPVCSTCLFATLQFIQSPFCCSPWFHCCAQEARSAILFSSDASSLSGVEFPGLMMYRGDEATENQALSAQAAGQYIHLYIYMQSAKSSEAAVIMVHLLLLVHDPQKGQAVSQSNLAQIWPSGHSRWNRKKNM